MVGIGSSAGLVEFCSDEEWNLFAYEASVAPKLTFAYAGLTGADVISHKSEILSSSLREVLAPLNSDRLVVRGEHGDEKLISGIDGCHNAIACSRFFV